MREEYAEDGESRDDRVALHGGSKLHEFGALPDSPGGEGFGPSGTRTEGRGSAVGAF